EIRQKLRPEIGDRLREFGRIARMKFLGQADVEHEQCHGDAENTVMQGVEPHFWIHGDSPLRPKLSSLVPTFRSPRNIAAIPLRGLRKIMDTSKIHDSSAALDLKSLNRISQRMRQGLQIGGTSPRFEGEMTANPPFVREH